MQSGVDRIPKSSSILLLCVLLNVCILNTQANNITKFVAYDDRKSFNSRMQGFATSKTGGYVTSEAKFMAPSIQKRADDPWTLRSYSKVDPNRPEDRQSELSNANPFTLNPEAQNAVNIFLEGVPSLYKNGRDAAAVFILLALIISPIIALLVSYPMVAVVFAAAYPPTIDWERLPHIGH